MEFKKVEDFRNTWCYCTEDNYDALVKSIKDTHMTKQERLVNYKSEILFIESGTIDSGDFIFSKGLKQIKLIDNDFYYVNEEKEEDSFNKFGFETPEFEGELWKIKKCPDRKVDILLGYYMRSNAFGNKELECGEWNAETGVCCVDGEKYNLAPIKKPWFENEDNIGRLLIKKNTNLFFCFIGLEENCPITIDLRNGVECTFKNNEDLRPATKEEVLKLIVE